MKTLPSHEESSARCSKSANVIRRSSAHSLALLASIVIPSMLPPLADAQNGYVLHNLVSDLPGLASHADTNLLNPWGIAFSATGPFWISDNHGGVSTIYNSSGTPQSLIVNIPPPAGGTAPGAPTGIIFNSAAGFPVAPGTNSHFIFATEDGTIIGWNSGTNAVVIRDNSTSGAVYKGLAIGTNAGGTYIYAADFHNSKIDVFGTNNSPATLTGIFNDPNIPTGFAPFGIQNVGGQLFVTYAKQDADKHDDVAGPGNGYVDIFDTSGNLVERFASAAALNSPWGIAKAPVGFGPFGGDLLIGNFGDGVINVYDMTGTWLGAVNDATGNNPVAIPGLWGLVFGNGGNGGDSHTLYFTAGIPGSGALEDHGLFGSLSAVYPGLLTGASYIEHDLVSNLPGRADHTDTNLLNPWGISFSATSPFWISDNHSGLSTLYNSSGTPQTLVVTIPPPPGGTPPSGPSGTIFNSTTNFIVSGTAAARFIFSTEDGTIAAWASGATAVIKADNSARGAVYKGLAAGSSGGSNYLYAADFHNGRVDVFDASFNAATLAGSFADATIPAGYAPFNIQNIGGQLYVAYAAQGPGAHDDAAGPGHGYVNVFTTSGQLVKRLASTGVLNSPWGIALAPAGFGGFAGALLVGNFGDGRINAFDPATGAWLGTVNDASGNPFAVEGLWALAFGNGGNGGEPHTLYFTAGLNGETDGLFGSLAPVTPTITSVADKGLISAMNWAGGSGTFLLQKKASLSGTNWLDVLTTQNRSMATTATGLGTLTIEGSNLTYNINFSGLSGPATLAHIHAPADATHSTGPLIPLTVASATSGTISGTTTITPDQLAYILNGMAYVNIHTGNNPGGEIRGQIVPLRIAMSLNGAQEVSPVNTPATGTGSLTLVGNQLYYDISYSGLQGSATAAHIHGPADPTLSTGVLIPLKTPSGTSGNISGSVSLTPTNMAYLLAGLTYINIHSVSNSTGEIRGQIYPVQFSATLSGANEVGPATSTGTGSGFFTVVNNLLSYNVSFANLLSPATASHIHGPATPAQNALVLIPFSGTPAATSGTISGTAALTPQELFDMAAGLTYANIHTTNYPGGEIRGQVLPRN
ncbi:MAG: TIGR03118 family protein [Verrucomicrobia bacterium]|nr:TIGR03118 family protein [Verrucomicrobiota bacterium]